MVRVSAVSHPGVRPSNEDRHPCQEAPCLFVAAEGVILPEPANPNDGGRDSTANVLTRTRGVQEHADIYLSERDRKPSCAKVLRE
jgi:hypothetical protein